MLVAQPLGRFGECRRIAIAGIVNIQRLRLTVAVIHRASFLSTWFDEYSQSSQPTSSVSRKPCIPTSTLAAIPYTQVLHTSCVRFAATLL